MHRGLAAILVTALIAPAHVGTAPIAVPRRTSIAADTLPIADRLRLAEAFRLAAALGDTLWRGWSRAPFAVLLVTAEREFLMGHPQPTPDFVRTGYDSILASDVFVRPRTMPTGLLATFPLFDSTPVIVIGEAGNTGQRSTAWVLTVLHEHFHQWQMSQPLYQDRVKALDLARDDRTGMWMLNYPFPYASPAVRARFRTFARSLVVADTAAAHLEHAHAMLDARRALRRMISPADARYLDFQLWQEGVARYTELRMAQLASRQFTPSAGLQALPGFTSFGAEADSLTARIQSAGIRDLAEAKREAFYPLGAAQALFLDRGGPDWKEGYVSGPLSLDAMLAPSAPPAPGRRRP
jgi:hypothetical protein